MTNDQSLISELLTIYQGKYVVRVAVQVDGIVRATGMAAAETLEAAEDRARERAKLLLSPPLTPPTAEKIPVPPTPPETIIQPTPSQLELSPPTPTKSQLDFGYTSELTPTKESNISSTGGRGKSKLAATPTTPQEKDIFDGDFAADLFTASSRKLPLSTDSSEPFNYESHVSQDETPTETQSIDLTENLKKIEVKLKESRLKLNDERECLEINYGIGSRYELTALQSEEFIRYLELYNQTTQAVKELQELGWNAKEEAPKYLQEEYNKSKRHQLTITELQGFLEFLQFERDRISIK